MLPQQPVVYFAAAAVIGLVAVAGRIFWIIWRGDDPRPPQGSWPAPSGTTEAMGSLERMAAAMRQLSGHFTYYRERLLEEIWLEDYPQFNFITWRVTARPFDWRID